MRILHVAATALMTALCLCAGGAAAVGRADDHFPQVSLPPARGVAAEPVRLSSSLTGFYLLSVEAAADSDRRPVHDVQVTTRRQDVQVLSARRWAATVPAGGIVTVGPSAGAVAVKGPMPSPDRPADRRLTSRADPEMDLVLSRLADYLQAYLRDYTNVVAEERYEQEVINYPAAAFGTLRATTLKRVLRSDVLMVSTPSLGRWLPFRDVFEMDGKPIRDREERLRKLFLVPAGAVADARRITSESARFNLGSVDRTTNVPTLALELWFAANLSRLRLEKRDEDPVAGTRTRRIDFEEVPPQTLIRGTGGEEVPSRGSIWVDPLTGRVLKTVLRTAGPVKTEITVTYRLADAVGLWLPWEMREQYSEAGQQFTGVARYSNFRRFQVTTDQSIKRP